MKSTAIEKRNSDEDCRGRQIVRTSGLIPKSKSVNPNRNSKPYQFRNAVSQDHSAGVVPKKDNERHKMVNGKGVPSAFEVDDSGKIFLPSRNGVEYMRPLSASNGKRTCNGPNMEVFITDGDEQMVSKNNTSRGKIYSKMQNIISCHDKLSVEDIGSKDTIGPQEYHGKWLAPQSESSDDITTKYQSEPDESLESADDTSGSDIELWQLPKSEVHNNNTTPNDLDFQYLRDGISGPRSEQPDALILNEPTWKNISRTQQKILDFKELLYDEKDETHSSHLSRQLGKSHPRNNMYDHNIKLQYEAINTEYMQIRLRFSNWGTLQSTKKAENNEESPNYGIGLLGFVERLKNFPPKILSSENVESTMLGSDPYQLEHYIADMWDEETNANFFSNE